jgi:hypothetical protein
VASKGPDEASEALLRQSVTQSAALADPGANPRKVGMGRDGGLA